MTTITAQSARQGQTSANHTMLRLVIFSTGLAAIGLALAGLLAG